MPDLTIFRCGDPLLVIGDAVGLEALWVLDVCARQAEEQEDDIRRADAEERMAGRCDLCQLWPNHGLTVCGGVALCDECLEAQRAPEEEP